MTTSRWTCVFVTCAALLMTTKGRVHLEPCWTVTETIEALCGTYDVYENRDTHAGRRIALNVMVIPTAASAPQPDPFFALADLIHIAPFLAK